MMRRRWLGAAIALCLCACRADTDRTETEPQTAASQHRWVLEAGSLRALPVGAEVPEGAEAVITVEVDPAGRVLRHIEEPTSESGDWSLAFTHTFDTSGAATRYESVGRYFRPDSLCTAVVEDHRTWTRRSPGEGWDSTRTLTGQSGSLVPEEVCGHAYEFFAGQRFESYGALVAATRAPRRP